MGLVMGVGKEESEIKRLEYLCIIVLWDWGSWKGNITKDKGYTNVRMN